MPQQIHQLPTVSHTILPFINKTFIRIIQLLLRPLQLIIIIISKV
jgi:hypothetical protein